MTELAVVTGGGSGLGREIARCLASRGMDVLVTGRRASMLQETCSADPERLSAVAADVSSRQGWQAVSDAVGEREVHCLVHNAGVLSPIGPLSDVQEQDWNQSLAVNLTGPLFLTQALLPRLTGGRVLHMSSGAAHHGYAGWGAYCVTKAGLHMLYQVLREELKGRDVAVGSLRPGVVNTPMQGLIREQSPERFPGVARFVELHEKGQLEDPAEVAEFACWLLLEVPAPDYVAEEWSFTDQEQRARWKRK
ncbi:MAG: SDR family oxidoreductase [Ectothiorhodospiraceae bacterium]|nr:SDR family oxidoreductase [Ectothiorhodospiraceae bacterium]